MANKNPLPTFIEQLPTEIFLQIFRYYHLREIISAFFGLNYRINSIVQSFRNASHIVQYNDHDTVQLLSVFSKQIARLIIIKMDMIDLTSLSNLRSLTLKYINNAQIQSIRPQDFPLLEMLRIYVWPQTLLPENGVEVDELFEMILNNAFPRLWLCTAVGVVPLSASDTWSTSPSLRFLYVPMKRAHGYERLAYICPNLRWIPSSKDALVDPLNQVSNIGDKAKKRIWKALNDLNELELEGKFIPEVNPFIVFESQKHRSYTQQANTVVIYGRIFPQAKSYCRTSLLIKIEFSVQYPFKSPEITFLDPICNSIIDEDGKISFEWRWQHIDSLWYPMENVTNVLRKVINIDDQDFSIATAADDEKPPRDVAEQLLQYLDILYPNGKPINPLTNTVRTSSPVYKDEVKEFFHIVDVYTEDMIYDRSRIFEMAYNHEKIAKANWKRIKQMLAFLSKRRKFSHCNDAGAIENGGVKWILLRLKELVEQ